jgi:16S rRNA (guanine527-N7)-methyltransferase
MLDSAHPKIREYRNLLLQYNETTNIYSKKSYNALDFHIQDSINLANLISKEGVHVDMGSGSGLPGIILAILMDVNVVCLESRLRKRDFLTHSKNALGLKNLEVFDGDIKMFAKRYSGKKIGGFSAKALAKPPKVLDFLSDFKMHSYNQDAVCWIPVSKNQVEILGEFGHVETVEVAGVYFYYFMVLLKNHRDYKEDLRNRYNL